MIECIYCEELKPRAAFNRDHVMPEAFGTFEGNNFVLHGMVCRSCNKDCGRILEPALSHESMEGMQRFVPGLLQAHDKHRFGVGPRFRITLRGHLEGPIVEQRAPADGSPGLVLYLVPQIGIASTEDGPYRYFRLQEMPSPPELIASGFKGSRCFLALGCDWRDARQVLVDLGFVMHPEDEEVVSVKPLFEPGAEVNANVHMVIDEITARAVAKIAVNYFAYHYPLKIRMPQFAAIRRFVRRGGGNWRSFVVVSNEPVVASFPREAQVFTHAVTALWDPASRTVRGQVTLFNLLQYKILLGHGFDHDESEICSGHLFDPKNRVILPLTTEKQRMVDLSKHTQIDL